MSIQSIPNEVILHVFSFLSPLEELSKSGVCIKWNQLVLNDTRWRKLAIEVIKERNILFLDPKSETSFLPHVRQFCVVSLKHFPNLFSGKISSILNDIPGALTKLDTMKKEVEETDILDAVIKKSVGEVRLVFEKMRLVNCKLPLGWLTLNLRNAIHYDRTRIPDLLDKLAAAKYRFDIEFLKDFLICGQKECHGYIPYILENLDKDSFEKINDDILNMSLLYVPEFSPLLLKVMKTTGQIPETTSLLLAARNCPQHIPLILEAMLEGGHKPDAILKFVKEKLPEHFTLVEEVTRKYMIPQK